MTLTTDQLQNLADLASQAARGAGALIAGYGDREVEVREKPGGHTRASQVVTEVDERSEATILEALAPSIERFDLALLTEEREDDRQRLEKDYFWCIDPLDGTLPFTWGIAGYAVSIALVRRDGKAVIGVVFDPVRQTIYRAVAGGGVTIDGEPFRPTVRTGGPLRFFCDCTFPEHPGREALIDEVEAVAERLGYSGVEIIEKAGAVLNACRVMTEGPACYFKTPKAKPGGGSLWDFAATACLFAEAELHARDFEGGVLELNRRESTFLNHRGVCYASSVELAVALRVGT